MNVSYSAATETEPLSPTPGKQPLATSRSHFEVTEQQRHSIISTRSDGTSDDAADVVQQGNDSEAALEGILQKNYEANVNLEKKSYQLEEVRQQNSKLWCLVNKQRDMIFELQKDLNNALKRIGKLTGESPSSPNSPTSPYEEHLSANKKGLNIITSSQPTNALTGRGSSPISPSMISDRTENGLASPPSSLSPVDVHPSFTERHIKRRSSPVAPKSSRQRISVFGLKLKKNPQEDSEIMMKEDFGNSQLQDLSSAILENAKAKEGSISSSQPDSSKLSTPSSPRTERKEPQDSYDEESLSEVRALAAMPAESDSDQNTITDIMSRLPGTMKNRPLNGMRMSEALGNEPPVPPLKSPRHLTGRPKDKAAMNENASLTDSQASARLSGLDTFEGGTLDHRIELRDIASKVMSSSSGSSASSFAHSSGSVAALPPRNAEESIDERTFLDQISEELFCMNPKQLSSFSVVVCSCLIGKTSSSLRPAGMKESPVALFSVRSLSNDKEGWNFLKSYQQLVELDTCIRPQLEQFALPKLPDKSVFASHAPVKVDARRQFLNEYFSSLLCNLRMPPEVSKKVAHFLSVGIVSKITALQSQKGAATPEKNKFGYLTKRGRSLGGWKTRFFVLNGPYLNYYDKPDGDVVGTIVVANSGIGRQRSDDASSLAYEENRQYRHAFLIIEKKGDVKVSHVLCAESDEERDKWVEALLAAVNFDTSEEKNVSPLAINPWIVRGDIEEKNAVAASATSEKISGPINGHKILDAPTEWKSTMLTNSASNNNNNNNNNSSSYDRMERMGGMSVGPTSRRPSQSTRLSTTSGDSRQEMNRGGTLASDDGTSPFQTGNLFTGKGLGSKGSNTYSATKRKQLFGLRSKMMASNSSSSSDINEAADHYDPATFKEAGSEQEGPYRVFGVPLSTCIKISSVEVDGYVIPSILYRTTEFLKVHNAHLEKGIFRVNGSSAQIRHLAMMFDEELDVNLLEQDCDINAVCGLLKKWLIELPDPVLTTELESEFKIVAEIEDKHLRRDRIRELLLELPRANRDMITVLCGYMALMLEFQELNKMNNTNLGIIFSQTLKMPPMVFDRFLSDYHGIFDDDMYKAE